MFKKQWIAFCCTAALLLPVCGCGADNTPPVPQLVIGCDDYEPYNYADGDGEPAGMDVELAVEACRRMGYAPVFQTIDWNQRDALLESGEIDCIWSCYSMDGQEERYAWVGPYMRSRQVVAVLADSPITSLSDLAGKSVGVRVESKAEDIFLSDTDEDIPPVGKVYCLNTVDELATALRNEYVDAIAGYAAAAREALRNDGIRYRFLEETLSATYLGIAFSKSSDSELRQKLSDALGDMLSDGTTEQILDRYGVDTEKALGGLRDA